MNVQKAIKAEAKKLHAEVDAVAKRIAAAIMREAFGNAAPRQRRRRKGKK